MRILTTLLFSAGALASVGLRAQRSEACSPPRCTGGETLPATGATIPQNAPGVVIFQFEQVSQPPIGPVNVSLRKADTGEVIPANFSPFEQGTLVTPTQPWQQGASYTVLDGSECLDKPPTAGIANFTIGPAAALPSGFGQLSREPVQREQISVATASGSCSATVDAATLRPQLLLDTTALPWQSLLVVTTMVNNKPYRYRRTINDASPLGRLNGDLLWTNCSANNATEPGLAQGVHRVKLVATLPGTNQQWSSNEIEVDLFCAAPENPMIGSTPGCQSSETMPVAFSAILFGLLVSTRRRNAAA